MNAPENMSMQNRIKPFASLTETNWSNKNVWPSLELDSNEAYQKDD
jgi:hypothetical protein